MTSAWLLLGAVAILAVAAALEAGGDALIFRAFEKGPWPLALYGCLALAAYGLVVKLTLSMKLGLALIVLGGLVIQFGDAVL